MNRTLKRPMFRMGGSTGTGITSGLDQPRKQYRQGSPNPLGPGTLPGFLTGFGINLASTPPQGNIIQTAATAAKDPFQNFQAAKMRQNEMLGERDFLRGEREAGQEFKAAEGALNRKTQLEIAAMRGDENNPLYNASLESFLENLPPQVAERAAAFNTEMADTLRGAVGGQRYGGVLEIDIRDPEQGKIIKKQKNRFDNKVFYDPYEDNYKYIVIRNGEIAFDQFTTIPEIKFPDFTATPPEKTDRSVPDSDFGMSMDDPSP